MNKLKDLKQTFPMLDPVIAWDSSHGIMLKSYDLKTCRFEGTAPSLKYYFADSNTSHIIEHNLRWAVGEYDNPIFQFAYIMLPTFCNQSCRGCFMGQDKKKLPPHLDGSYMSERELTEILTFLKNHGTRAVVYGGGGELFTWNGAFEFIKTITDFGLKAVIFTNGTLLSKNDIVRLNDLGVVLIISLRDNIEEYHNRIVGYDGFFSALLSIEYALEEGMHFDNRLAVEIPVTKENEQRVIDDFLPAMRLLNIVPMIEEYIQLSLSEDEKKFSHNFSQARSFFEHACMRDKEIGFDWTPELGTRMVGQPQCKRPLYSFAVFPSRDVMDCPSHSILHGNLNQNSLEEIIYSKKFKENILKFELCACSVFYTSTDAEIFQELPNHLAVFK